MKQMTWPSSTVELYSPGTYVSAKPVWVGEQDAPPPEVRRSGAKFISNFRLNYWEIAETEFGADVTQYVARLRDLTNHFLPQGSIHSEAIRPEDGDAPAVWEVQVTGIDRATRFELSEKLDEALAGMPVEIRRKLTHRIR